MNKLQIRSFLLSLRDPDERARWHAMSKKSFNVDLFAEIWRRSGEFENPEEFLCLLAMATFCKPGELECKAGDKELMRRMQQIAQVIQAKNAAAP